MLKITSMQNSQVKGAVKLKNRRARDEAGLFLIEGFRELTRALVGGVSIEKVFICHELFLGENEQTLLQKLSFGGAALIECLPSVFEKLSYRDRPDGLMGIGCQMKRSLDELPQKDGGLYVIAEAIEKPGNLGSILRSADGVGADGVIVCDRCTDIYNPNVVRASVGTLFTLPVIEADADEIFAWLRGRGIRSVATSPAANCDYTEADLSESCAIVVGTEQLGLSKRWLEQSNIKVSIPMRGVADSLNVATATTLLLYEAIRQRKEV